MQRLRGSYWAGEEIEGVHFGEVRRLRGVSLGSEEIEGVICLGYKLKLRTWNHLNVQMTNCLNEKHLFSMPMLITHCL